MQATLSADGLRELLAPRARWRSPIATDYTPWLAYLDIISRERAAAAGRWASPRAGEKGDDVQVSEVASGDRWIEGFSDAFEWLARLLRDEGVDLMTASGSELARGTPVYVEGDAEVGEVQRRMARKHIRRLPVLRDGQLVGIVDFVDLAMMAGD